MPSVLRMSEIWEEPDEDTAVHGDLQYSNAIFTEDKRYFIDLGDFCCGNRLELMIGQLASEMLLRGRQRIIELIIRVIHLVHLENIFQAAFLKTCIMGDRCPSSSP